MAWHVGNSSDYSLSYFDTRNPDPPPDRFQTGFFFGCADPGSLLSEFLCQSVSIPPAHVQSSFESQDNVALIRYSAPRFTLALETLLIIIHFVDGLVCMDGRSMVHRSWTPAPRGWTRLEVIIALRLQFHTTQPHSYQAKFGFRATELVINAAGRRSTPRFLSSAAKQRTLTGLLLDRWDGPTVM
ncbi:hypothetical protein C8F04DRAFT_1195860 [Mycena alexandri]|uniref:Uncharacterized protein n=1 Tax=Mycena alexandri TaxID=1745969 RepID=A0AAD6S6I2_9AGAR|nr:hypothetical protein C8F04DRAFT_1195860 [Mycena alexandri]